MRKEEHFSRVQFGRMSCIAFGVEVQLYLTNHSSMDIGFLLSPLLLSRKGKMFQSKLKNGNVLSPHVGRFLAAHIPKSYFQTFADVISMLRIHGL